jgi:hypothetical protein
MMGNNICKDMPGPGLPGPGMSLHILWNDFGQVEVDGAFTQAIEFFDDGEVGGVRVVGLQVGFVDEAHDDAMGVGAGIGAVVFAC